MVLKSWNCEGNHRLFLCRCEMIYILISGISEEEWKLFAKSVKVTRSQGLSQMSHKLVIGARLKVVYETNALGLKKGEFLLEKGPSHHHISFMIAYFLDRTLGVSLLHLL